MAFTGNFDREKLKQASRLSSERLGLSKEQATADIVKKLLAERKQAVFQRFPLLFTLLTAFGLVATFYGFEGVMDQIGLADEPVILLGIGLGILVFTGSLYKKLGD